MALGAKGRGGKAPLQGHRHINIFQRSRQGSIQQYFRQRAKGLGRWSTRQTLQAVLPWIAQSIPSCSACPTHPLAASGFRATARNMAMVSSCLIRCCQQPACKQYHAARRLISKGHGARMVRKLHAGTLAD